MRLWPALTVAVLFASALPDSAHAICTSPTLCRIDQAGRHCKIFHNVCKAVPPQTAATEEKTYSIELKDLTQADVQKISDLLGLQIDASKLDIEQ